MREESSTFCGAHKPDGGDVLAGCSSITTARRLDGFGSKFWTSRQCQKYRRMYLIALMRIVAFSCVFFPCLMRVTL
jgi:hypothetical protein